MFYLLKTADSSLAAVLPTCSVFQREMALAGCSALAPHLAVLAARGINSLALRVSTNADMVNKRVHALHAVVPGVGISHGGWRLYPRVGVLRSWSSRAAVLHVLER